MHIKSLVILSVCASALISVGCVALKSIRSDKDAVEKKEIGENLSKEEEDKQSQQSQQQPQLQQSQQSQQSQQLQQLQQSQQSQQSEVAIHLENQVIHTVEIEEDSNRSLPIDQKSTKSLEEKLEETKETSYTIEKKTENSNIQLVERVEKSIELPPLEENTINKIRDTQVSDLLNQAEDLKKIIHILEKENGYLKSANSSIIKQLEREREINQQLRTQLKSQNNNQNTIIDKKISNLTNCIGQNGNNNNIPHIINNNNSMGLKVGLPRKNSFVSVVNVPVPSPAPVPSSATSQLSAPVLVPVQISIPVPPPLPSVNGFKKCSSAIQCRPPPFAPKPIHPLKALHWTKLPAAKVNESLFVKLGPMNNINLPWKSIEDVYAAKSIIREKKAKGLSQVIDTKFGKNISIFLSQFKAVSTKQLIQWIQNMDEQGMSRDQVKQLSKLLPSEENMAALREFLQSEDRSKLSLADQYCLDIGSLPFAREKISMFLLKCEFKSRLDEVEQHIGAVSLTCEDIFKSKKLLRIIEIVLVLGNFINYGTPRGAQSAFKIDTLYKLGDTKSSDLSSNLVYTLVNYCIENEPQLLTFADEMKSLTIARKAIWSGVVADVSSIADDVNCVKKMVLNLQKSNEPFNQSILQFLTSATSKVESMRKNLESTYEKFKKLCTFFAEDSSQIQPEELFDIIGRFITLFENGATYLQHQKEEQENEVKRQQQKKQRLQRAIKSI